MADPTPTPTPETGEDVTALKNALAQERDARKQAEKDAKAAKERADGVEARLAKLESDGKSESEKATEKARNEAKTEATKERDEFWSSKFIRAEVKAVAAQKLADPDDARLLDLDGFGVNEDGTIKGDIGAAVDKLIESKPHLAAKKATRQTIDAGPQGGAAGDSVDEVFGRAMTDAAGIT